MACAQVQPVRKEKKKQAKDELDRLKQAEKKRRRLEKALATSAAIRSELEKKKQKKKEEQQQQLDEEGAAIAEAVALHVLLGEDSDDSCKIVLKKDEGLNPSDCASNVGFFMGGWRSGPPHKCFTKCSLKGFGWVPDAYVSGCKWNDGAVSGWSFPPGVIGRDLRAPYFDGKSQVSAKISAELIAAQAVSSLQIVEDASGDIVVNGMLRGVS